MLTLFASPTSLVISNNFSEFDNISGVKVIDLPKYDPYKEIYNRYPPVGQYSNRWNIEVFKEIKGNIDIEIDNETFFYVENFKTLYIKTSSKSIENNLVSIDLINGDLEVRNMSDLDEFIESLKPYSIKETIVKLNFK